MYNGDYMNWVPEPREHCENALLYSKSNEVNFEPCMFDKNYYCPLADRGVKK